ncbi:MAG: hypothetical protein CM1200mP2_19550 [Planctomycetaceae bacterium]|nr:MAG: hypothetical protein CM1200mP2_19550 [Planctomycetaceae bacterium]
MGPGEELDRLWGCLSPGGVLGIMTKRVLDHEAFSRWHYKKRSDPRLLLCGADIRVAGESLGGVADGCR